MVFVALSPPAPTASVTVVSAFMAAAAVARTVTEVSPAPSAILTFAGTVASAIVGRSSSVSVRAVLDIVAASALVPVTWTVSSPSRAVSSVGVRVNEPVPLVAFAAIAIVKSDTAA